jgi:hypothetical protein
MSLSAAMLLSMPPAVITITVPQWRYFNGSDWTIGSVVNKSLQFPRGSAWGVLGMMAGHSNVQLSDSMLYFGGFTYRDDSNVPVPTPNNVYMRVTRSRISPVCSTTVATASPLYAISGGFRQDSKTSDSTGSCLVCIAGRCVLRSNHFPFIPNPGCLNFFIRSTVISTRQSKPAKFAALDSTRPLISH